MMQAIGLIMALTKAATDIAELVQRASEEGRDLTADEMLAVRQRRDDADQAFLAELQRLQDSPENNQ